MEKSTEKSMCVLISALLYLCLQHAVSELTSVTFIKEAACRLPDRTKLGFAELKCRNCPGLVKCAAACMDQCFGVSVDEYNNCYHHKDYTANNFSCTLNEVYFYLYFRNPCEHDGQWNPVKHTCKCVGGWVGDRCQRYPTSCKELSLFGYEDAAQKSTMIQPETYPNPFLVYCSYYRNNKRYVTYIFRNKGLYNMTLNWKDYVNGFYYDYLNYWIGLDKIKVLNDAGSRNVELRGELNMNTTTEVKYIFQNFRIGSAQSGYNFTVVSANQNSNNCLTPVQGVSFSTPDQDNDKDGANCARNAKAGWWFKTCDVGCSPLGPKPDYKFTGLNLQTGNPTIDMYFVD